MLFNFKMPVLFIYYFGMACFGYEGVLVLYRIMRRLCRCHLLDGIVSAFVSCVLLRYK